MMVEGGARATATPDFGEHYDVVVVGAGIGGLACGALLAKEGAKVLIAERHSRPGGFVADYERKGYRFQVPHIAGGFGPGGDLTRVIDHLGIRVEFHRVEPLMRFIYPDHDITVPSALDEYADVLKEAFQPQTTNINSFFKDIAAITKRTDMRMTRRPLGFANAMKMAAYPFVAPKVLSYMMSGTTFQKMLDKRFTDERLKTVISTPWGFLGCPPWEVSALSMVSMMKSFADGAFVPLGGFQVLADAFAKAFTDSGGTLLFNHEVTSINTDKGRVSEVEMVPRAKVSTEFVVSDADSKRTLLRLLDRENFTTTFLERVDEAPVSLTGFVVHLGLGKKLGPEFAGGPLMVSPSYDEREMLEEVSVKTRYPESGKIRWSMMAPSMVDPSLAPHGKTCLDVIVPCVPYNFMRRWGVEEGGVRGEKYKGIKEKYAEVVVDAVARTFPDLVSHVEAFDIATPITYERYTMAIDGCWYDSAPTGRQAIPRRPGPKTPVGGLLLTGSKSVFGGGIYPAIMAGVLAADTVTGGGMDKLFPA
ncbi:MAG: phytoene desaturase family protein [Candidatus Geothermincolia bacterium]